jgi:hypothetical protein
MYNKFLTAYTSVGVGTCRIPISVIMRHVVCVGGKGKWNASVLAQKAQVGRRVPLSCTSHRNSAAQVVGGRVPRSRSLSVYQYFLCVI